MSYMSTHAELLKQWRATLNAKEKAIVDALPPATATDGRTGSEDDVATWSALSYEFDPADQDTEGERLAEQFGVTVAQGDAIAAFVDEACAANTRKVQVEVVGTVLGEFLGAKSTDLAVIFWSLAFSSGLATRLTDAGPAAKAKELGVTKSLISSWQRRWTERFGLLNIVFSKSAESRAKMSESAKRRGR